MRQSHASKNLYSREPFSRIDQDKDLFLFDGFPIPVIHIKHYKRSKTLLKVDRSVGYRAAKNHHYFGFKGHLIVTQQGVTKAF